MLTPSKNSDPPIAAPALPAPTSNESVISRERIRLTGTNQPQFRGDSLNGLLGGTVWSFSVGLIALLMGFSALHFLPILAFTAICWTHSFFLLRRWSTLRFGSAVLLQPEGFIQFPLTRNPPPLLPWKSGLEITFTLCKGVWNLRIRDNFRSPVNILLPAQSDHDIDSIRATLTAWQPNTVFIESL